MKALKMLLFVTMLYCGQANLFAQSNEVKGGVKGGLNVSNIGGDSEGTKSKMGIHVGGFVQFRASNSLCIQPELVYSMQGASLGDGVNVKYNYINVPVIFKLYPESHGFNFQAGPQLGILGGAKVSDGSDSIDVSDQVEGIDFALAVGLGYDFNGMTLDARYNIGLSSTSDAGSYPNNVFQLGLGVYF
ncbi:porin family protein [Flammeovirga sp. EKP202]|uniref:porin family protein n=1 Tax=Flammeovirga sp. EKP202 TaxID=2770592 RepID=UPI00165F7450|nr:porin family protein [Flammeovirga sp. EKP202]MBD0403156.1 PorT family protein [Flammeovirga sp. EKP202]